MPSQCGSSATEHHLSGWIAWCTLIASRPDVIPKRVGITKRIGWHTFRRTYSTLLHKNGEDVKTVQELLRHGSSKVTMDVYAQAVTSAKRSAQQKVVSILREEMPGTLCVPGVSPANFTG